MLLEIRDLVKEYTHSARPIRAVDHLSFSLTEGEITGVCGKSGSGKSTLIRLICQFTPADSGQILFAGKDITHLSQSERRELYRHIQLVFQNPFRSFHPRFTLEHSVRAGLYNYHLEVPEEQFQSLIREVQLTPETLRRYPHQVSGGECQRAAILRALCLQPQLLLCDEATSALDPNTTHAILQLIQKINRELGITVVIITHQMSVVEEVCNRVAILDNGTVVEEGEVQAIFSHPTSKAARRLVYPAGAPQAEVLPGHKLVRVAFGGTQTTDKPLVASLAIECGALVSIMAADTRIVNGQTLGSMLLALPDDDKAAAALEYIRNYPGITFEEVNG